MTKDVLVRGFSDDIHADLSKKADQMGVSINSIVKDAVDQWLNKKTHVRITSYNVCYTKLLRCSIIGSSNPTAS